MQHNNIKRANPNLATSTNLTNSVLDKIRSVQGTNARQKINVGEGTWEAEVDLVQSESLGCEIDRAVIRRDPSQANQRRSSQAKKKSVQDVAHEIAERVSYLHEPLVLSEYDTDAEQALMRSAKLTPTEAGNAYYEVDVRPNEVEVQRHTAKVGEPRKKATMKFTHETLGRLIDDLSKSMD